MMVTDPISDFLARIRNAQMVNHPVVTMPSSKMKQRIAGILKDEGYISDVAFEADDKQGKLTLTLKYDGGTPIIEGLKRISKPGLRVYRGSKDLPKVRGGLGMAVVSTSRGLMTDEKARENNVGGEVLCYVW
jgi:small subunit ribosomal protein S8